MKTGITGMLKLGFILAAYATTACVILAFVYNTTLPIITQRQQADNYAAIAAIFPDADNFEPVGDIKSPDPDVFIEMAYSALKNGEVIGAALLMSRSSYSGIIKTMVGVSKDGYITRVKIMEHSDTPGLGANAASSSYYVDRARGITFYGQFTGKSINDRFEVKNDVMVITASTVTSVAVANSVRAAGLAVKVWLDGEEADVVTNATRREL
jgi:electron transport complex protein RnfG